MMLVFAAVVVDTPQEKETIAIDETLFYKISIGNREAFYELYDKTSNAVYSYALSLLRNCDDAEDAMQETYLKVRSAAHLYMPMGKPLAWIFTIARNICLMKYRQQKHRAVIPFEEIQEVPDCSQIKSREIGSYWKRHFRRFPMRSARLLSCMRYQGLSTGRLARCWVCHCLPSYRSIIEE